MVVMKLLHCVELARTRFSSVSCDTTHGGFLCKDSTACLPAAKVCDTNPDCQDKSDEEAYCSTTKSCSSHGCEQVSIQLSNITKGLSIDRWKLLLKLYYQMFWLI